MAISTDLGAILTAAAQSSTIAQLTGGTYTVTQPIIINLTSNVQALGLNGGGATIISQVAAGQPVIEYVLGAGVDCRYLDLSNFSIQGNGAEGDGIKVVADTSDRGAYNWNIDNVTVNHVGGYGIHMVGNVFEGLVSNTWVNNNGLGGALFEHSAGGGQVSALRWFGGGAQGNSGAGISLGNGGRDLSVDGASFSGNHGPGISAPSGITSVTGSTFTDNQGTGIDFDNYGNFNNDTFSTTGVQSTGIVGYLTGDATLLGNTSIYTGSGADPTTLANLTGNAYMLAIGDSGRIVTGPGVTPATSGGDMHASVQVSSKGIGGPALAAITTATTAAVADSNGAGTLETTLKAALTGGTVAHLPGTTNYTVSAPIVINLTTSNVGNTTGPIGIDLGGADMNSTMTHGEPVIEVVVGAGVNIGTLSLSNFQIHGTYAEGDGIKIVVNGTDRSIGTLQVTNVNLEALGGIGLDVLGNVSHTRIYNSWLHGDVQGGARFSGAPAGGVPSDMQWTGGGLRKNGVAGLILDNGAHDMTVKGLYFVENQGPGIHATSGITLVQASGFENNAGAGAMVGGAGGNFTDDTFSTYGPQTAGVSGALSGGKITMTGTDAEYYGAGSDPTIVANIQGSGTLNMAGGGKLVVGPGVTVAGASPVLAGAGNTAPRLSSISAPSGDLNAGKVVTLTAMFSEAVTVAGGTPTMALNDGGTATYTSGSGSSSLSFSYTVQAGQNVADLAVKSISLNGASIKDGAGLAADLSAAANYNPSGKLQIDTTAPAVTSIAASGSGITAGGGTLEAGSVVTLIVKMSEAVTVTGTPTLALSDGGTASYTGGSGTATLTFSHTVASGQNTADLAVSSLNPGTGSIVDGAGNAANLSAAANYNPAGTLQISTAPITTPKVSEKLVSDTGSSASDLITSNPALTGKADPTAVIHFKVEGVAIAATATANASGVWSFTPTSLADGTHRIGASETNAAGATGSAALKFTLDTTAPAVTDNFVAATATAGALLTGTGDASATVQFSVDGVAAATTATANVDGAWSIIAANLGVATGTHTVVAGETDTAGNTGTASLTTQISQLAQFASSSLQSGTATTVAVPTETRTALDPVAGPSLA